MRVWWVRFSNIGLWPRMIAAVSLGFLALFIAFAVLGEQALQDSADRILDERLVITHMVAGQIDGLLEEGFSELHAAHRNVNFDPEDPDLSAETEAMAHTFGSVGMFASGVIFLNSSSQVVLTHPPALYPEKFDLSGLSQSASTSISGKGTISKPFLDPLHGQPVTALTVPIYDDNSETLTGFLSGLMRLNLPGVTEPLERAVFLGHTAHAVLVDDQGRTLASTFDLPFLSPGEHYTFYRRAITNGQPTIETVPFELNLPDEPPGHLHVMAFVPLDNAPWGVAVGGDVGSETFAGVQRLRRGLAVLSVVAVICIWLMTLVGARQLIRPIQQLTRQAHLIADGNLNAPLSRQEGGEIGIMAEALDHMRRQLLTNIEQLAAVNGSLETRVARQTEGLRRQHILTQELLHQVITAQENERKRLANELHDEIGQVLTAVELSLSSLANLIFLEDKAAVNRLKKSRTLTQQAVDELRRIITALRPGILDELGLIPALDWMSDHILRVIGISVEIETIGWEERPSTDVETLLFRIAQEAMNNVARHSQASQLLIQLEQTDQHMLMTLTDNGIGFAAKTAVSATVTDKRGIGINSMRERAALAGGEIKLTSAPGAGTKIQVIIPVPLEN